MFLQSRGNFSAGEIAATANDRGWRQVQWERVQLKAEVVNDMVDHTGVLFQR